MSDDATAQADHKLDDLDEQRIDPSVSCSACDAVCCRLTVVVMPDDPVPRHFVERRDGLEVMARDEDGWCAAIDPKHMRCSIYDQRPGICRKFAMGGGYCRSERKAYRERHRDPDTSPRPG